MSLNGISIVKRNLERLHESEAWQRADEGQRLEITYRFIRSRYGMGSWLGFGPVHELPSDAELDRLRKLK